MGVLLFLGVCWVAMAWAFRRRGMNEIQKALLSTASELRRMAADRFAAYGSHDRRGAAIWDSASYISETVVPRYADPEPQPKPDTPLPDPISRDPLWMIVLSWVLGPIVRRGL